MKITRLPEDFSLEKKHPIQLYDYQSFTSQIKSKVNLTAHAFSFLLNGTKEIVTGHHPTFIQNTEFLIMKSGHCLMTEHLADINKSYRSILLFFSDSAINDFIRKYDLGFLSNTKHQSFQVCEYDTFILTFVNGLISLKSLDIELQSKLLKIKFEEIMLYLLETKGRDYLSFLTVKRDHQFSHFIKVIENNTLNKLSLKELAFLSNMSISTFKREFEKHFKTSPIKWFQDKRLEYAAFLLTHQIKRPSEIYEDIGYDNLSNFSQAFKKKYECTPRQYQNKK